jgi:ketosteroid isomerase-like protein
MSSENVEVVQRVIDAHDRGDVEAVFATYDPAIEWHLGQLEAPASDFELVYHGHEGVRDFWRQWYAAWETVTFEYEELLDAGPRVIAILSQSMRGRSSGVELDWKSYAQVWTVRNGMVTRVEFFPTRADAVAAVALDG